MALKIYYPEDIEYVLKGLATAQGATTAQALEQLIESGGVTPFVNELAKEHVAIFRAGFSTALAAVAAAFGLEG